MKNLDFATYGVEEMTQEEKIALNGGFIEFVYEVFTGRSLASDARMICEKAANAYAQVIKEGGTTSSQMPFP